MGFLDKIKGAVNPKEDDYIDEFEEYDDGFSDDGYDDEPGYTAPQTQTQNRPASRGMGLNSGALEMKVVKPERYDSQTAQKIADHLLSKRTVVLNLEVASKESARRLIDFLSGVAYSINGYMQKVANNTFIIVPENVDISGEQMKEASKQEEPDLY